MVHATTAGMNLATDLQHLAMVPASEPSIDEAEGWTSGGRSQKGYPFACGDVAILKLIFNQSRDGNNVLFLRFISWSKYPRKQ